MDHALDRTLECPPRDPRAAFAKATRRLLAVFWRNTAGALVAGRVTRIDPDRWSDAMLKDIGLVDLKSHRPRPLDWRRFDC